MKSKLLMIGFCGAWLAACGDGGGGGAVPDGGGAGGSGGNDLSFDDMCEQGAQKMCDLVSQCSSPIPNCVAQIKTQNCAGGPEVFCGAGSTYQPSKASTCLDTLDELGCEALKEQPAACSPEVLCAPQGGINPATPGEACHPVVPGRPKFADNCDPKASLCYAAGTSSSCPDRALCVGDGANGMTCAAPCTDDADCLSVGTGLICLQDCSVFILNGFCITPKAKSKLMQYTCDGTKSGPTTGTSGWSL